MTHTRLLLPITAAAPVIWGSSYYVATSFLPDMPPLSVAMYRALPAGLILLMVLRTLPPRAFLPKLMVLGVLNFTLFWGALFVAAYRLPGGVAATVGATQPFLVVFLAAGLLGHQARIMSVLAALGGAVGVGMMILTPNAALDPIGILAGLGGAAAMATGMVLSRKWQPEVPALTFTAWQLTAGGIVLLPLAWIVDGAPPLPTARETVGLIWLSGIGAVLTYLLWFRGIARIAPTAISMLGFLSPLSAVIIGWALNGEVLSPLQIGGMFVIGGAIWIGAQPPRRRAVAA